MARLIFVNLPVADLPRAVSFYEAIGAKKNPQSSDDTAACMVLSETIHAMLLTHPKLRQFTTKAIPDAKATCQVLLCVSADNRAEVDGMVERAGLPAAPRIPARSRTMDSCMAAASRTRTAIFGR
ncbi:VOC family protein [Dankookia sp. P2]|uniref:VOC family protein n=1 Tax=Dankookia sp. P2 TaxID=3423955 RepID=UPI003D665009